MQAHIIIIRQCGKKPPGMIGLAQILPFQTFSQIHADNWLVDAEHLKESATLIHVLMTLKC
jgi:hypothetical protein